MINKSRGYVAFAIVLLAAFAVFATKPQWQKAWMRMSGAVIPLGSRTLTSTEHHNQWLSVVGQRWVSRDRQEDAAAYYALIIPPQVPLHEDGSISSNDGVSHSCTQKWTSERDLGSREMGSESLKVSYHAIEHTVVIGSNTYSLTDGNLFVIHLDEMWKPQVTQIRATLNQVDGLEEARELARLALPDDEMVKRY